ncbi:cyclase family protein [Streptomyces brasiliensis]|uniref:Cyclase n=1 Tax=Streptomyces brasiliensis TaxID=1954 RepID=A0A917P3T6_9ACTN|nr:cyclase family protein [Streptomyces brasiliensis]GGJ59530.1 putative cyclase [Streptomyces brasiliensis]
MSTHAETVRVPTPVPEGTELLAGYISRLSNWGRWGPDDEIGTLNFVGPEQVRAAAALVRKGEVVPLSLPYDQDGCQDGGFRQNPQLLVKASGADYAAGAQKQTPWGPGKGFGFSDDVVMLPTQAGTQWDSLSHIFYGGRMYNDRPAALSTSHGSSHNGIQAGITRYVMRGVLLDVAHWAGVDSLDPGHPISAAELDAVAAAEGVEVRRGDAVLVRTGFLGARRGAWGDYAGGPAPGLSLHTAPWLYEKEVAAVVTDTWGVEVRPNEIAQIQPLHTVALVHMGLALGEIFDLDALGRHCAADGVYEFQFVAPPLPISGASGSPLSGLAIK